MIYLDYTSTTPVREEVLESFIQTTKNFWGNPSSLHKFGLISEDLLKMARKQMKELIDAKNYEVIFTSCATEANNLAIRGIALRKGNEGKHIITSKVEHPSVYETFANLTLEGYEVTYLDVDKDGKIDVLELEKAIRKDTILVSIMYVNNEIGTIMPVEKIGKLLKKYPKIVFHVDIVQALGKIPVALNKMSIDLATISAHKIYGLKGSGALFVRKGINLVSQQIGGSQEFNLRAGTVDVPSAVSLAKAMRLILEELEANYAYVLKLNHRIRQMLKQYEMIVINSPINNVSPYIINFSVQGVKSETFVHAFEPYEIYFSSKSACSSKLSKPSRILKAIGLDDNLASNSIRISLSHLTKETEIDELEKAFKEVLSNL